MTQMGMQMPGRRRPKATTPNVYTGLLLGAVVCLILAVVFVFSAGRKIGPADASGKAGLMTPLKIHEAGKPVKLPE